MRAEKAAGQGAKRLVIAAFGALMLASLAACASKPSAEMQQVKRMLDAITYEREEFSPAACLRDADGHILVQIEQILYRIPVKEFMFGAARPSSGRRIGLDLSGTQGCPENPFNARAVYLEARHVGPQTGSALSVGLIADPEGLVADRRAQSVLALAQDADCEMSDLPGFVECRSRERIGPELDDARYYIAVTADAPALNRAPFAIRCSGRDLARPCTVLDRYGEDAALEIALDPELVPLERIFALVRRVHAQLSTIRKGMGT
ncbi:MAG: hypothetical protein MRY63_02390 [Neomegalonema sp.]|nr:hypothetical protein [Neomegalonema sp.]